MNYCGHEGEISWWEHDARGIPLTRVCDKCYHDKMSQYKPEVLNDPNYDIDEQIEEES